MDTKADMSLCQEYIGNCKLTSSSSSQTEEHGGSVVECQTPEQDFEVPKPISTMLCP